MKGNFGYHLLALAVIAVWGVTFISTKILIGEGLSPSWIFAIRFTVAYLGIWALCAAGRSGRSASGKPSGAALEVVGEAFARASGSALAEAPGSSPGLASGEAPVAASASASAPASAPASAAASATSAASAASASGAAIAESLTLACASASVSGKTATAPSAPSRLFSRTLRDELLFVFLGVTGGSLYFLTENTALACTQACNVSFIVCSAPLFTALLTLIAKRILRGELAAGLEDVTGRWQLPAGTILALAGMAAVVFDGSELRLSARGDLLALAAALCWALYSIFMGQMTTKYGALFATRKVFFYGLITIVPFLLGDTLDPSVLLRPQVWGNLLFLSLAASLGCFILWNRLMSIIGNVTATNYVYLNPFFTLISAVLILGESLTLQSSLGCAAIIGGVILACLIPSLHPSRR